MAATVFNQAQLELLDMMQWVKSPEALAELKQVISDFFAKKGQEELDAMWERGEMTEEKLKSFETLHELPRAMRTSASSEKGGSPGHRVIPRCIGRVTSIHRRFIFFISCF